jgi:AraC family transcriptional regulator
MRMRNEKSLLSWKGDRKSALECHRHGVLCTDNPGQSSDVVISPQRGPRTSYVRGGLAPWQIRRVTSHIEVNLHAKITIQGLARLARISASHFAHAFKRSFGRSPHNYVLRRRTERAQRLMRASEASLGQIALECGLADQSHFTRLFHRFVGESPGAWRHARALSRAD